MKYGMTATFRRPRVAPRPYVLVQWRQRWQLVDGEWHREAVVERRRDGELRVVLLPDTTAAAA